MRVLSWAICVFMVTCTSPAAGELGGVTGWVVSETDHRPLPGAGVVIGGARLGGVTDSSGYYAIERVKPGTYDVEFSLVGYQKLTIHEVKISGGEPTRLTVTLKESPIVMPPVEVVEDRDSPQALHEEVKPTVRRLDPRQIKTIPGAVEDVLRSLQAVPGVTARSDYSSQVFVRGGGPDQNLLVDDGILISNAYHIGGLISAFNPDVVEEIELIPGGFPARYGDRLSAVLEIRNREGSRESFGLQNNTSVISTSTIVEGPLWGGKGSYLVAGRRSYYDLILNQIMKEDDIAFPYFYDIHSKFAYDLDRADKLTFIGYYSEEGFKYHQERGEEDEIPEMWMDDISHSGVYSLLWNRNPRSDLSLRTQYAYLFMRENFNMRGDLRLRVFVDGYRHSLNQSLLKITSPKHTLDLGWEYHHTYAKIWWEFIAADSLDEEQEPGQSSPFRPKQDDFDYSGSINRLGTYLSDLHRVSERVLLEYGLRLDYSDFVKDLVVSPRFNISYKIAPNTSLKGATGLFYQFPDYESYSEKGYFPETSRNPDLKAEKAIHYLVGLEHFLSETWKMKLDLYLKDMSQLVVDYMDTTLIPVNEGKAVARGTELYIEKQRRSESDRLAGWLGYTLGYSKLETPWSSYFYMTDQRHNLNLFAEYDLSSKVTLGATWRYGSGFPYTAVVGVTPVPVYDSSGAVVDTSDWKPIWGVTNGARYPAYHRLDLRATFKYKWLGLPWEAYVEIINVYNRKNVYTYTYNRRYTERNTIHELPLVPTFGFNVRF
jgi:outer membrane receptor for ferrienterochelin and colicin